MTKVQWKVQLRVRRMYGGAELAGSPTWTKVYVWARTSSVARAEALRRFEPGEVLEDLPPEVV